MFHESVFVTDRKQQLSASGIRMGDDFLRCIVAGVVLDDAVHRARNSVECRQAGPVVRLGAWAADLRVA
jgi:hypothetical protein